jgi:hypothetical protein
MKGDYLLKVEKARDLGPQFVDNPYRMIGQDGAFSIPLNGEALWFFGDTLIGEQRPEGSLWYLEGSAIGSEDMAGKGAIEKMLNNSGLILPNQDAGQGLKNYRYVLDENNSIKSLIPSIDNENDSKIRVWCQHGIYLYDKLYLSFVKVQMIPQSEIIKVTEEGEVSPVNFKVLGSGLAVGNKKDWKFRRLLHNGSDIIWGENLPHFGSAIYPDYDEGKLYLYGALLDGDGIQKCYLSRVSFEHIEDFDKYEYLSSNKPDWSPNIEDSIELFTDLPSEVSVSYNKYLGLYLAVHSWRTTNKIVCRTAPNLWGQWSEEIILWEAKVIEEKEIPYPRLFYAGKEHPELSKDNGKIIYITYVEFEEYFPHLIEITLQK